MTFTFTTREAYQAYRVDWKQRYFAAIAAIRKLKCEFHAAERAYSRAAGGRTYWEVDKATREDFGQMERLRSAVRSAKAEATGLLTERAQSKEEAARQREQRLKALRAAA